MIGIVCEYGSEIGQMRSFAEFKRLKFHIFEVDVVINIIKQNRIIGGIKHGPPDLDLAGNL